MRVSFSKFVYYLSILGLLFFSFSFLFHSDASFDQDLGRHLKLGEIISKSFEVPKTNLFSYTFPDFPFINSHYLFEVLIYQLQATLGLDSLLIIKVILFILTIMIVIRIIPNKQACFFLPITFIFLHLFRDRSDLRPEIISYLFTALTYFILEKYKDRNSKLIFFLPLIQLIWVNSHIYFVIGLSLQSIFLISFVIKRQTEKIKLTALILVLSIILSLLNPNFLQGFLFPLQLFNNYGYTIAENQSIFFLQNIGFYSPDFLFYKLSALIILVGIVIGVRRKNLQVENLLLALFGLFLATLNVRSFPYLILLSLPATVANIGIISNRKVILIVNIMTLGILFFESVFYLNGSYYKLADKDLTPTLQYKVHIKAAMDFTLAHNLPGPIYNNFDIGSYLIYRSYPKYKVYVDGRPEAYPASFFQGIYIPSQTNPSLFAKQDMQYHFQTVLFSITDQTPWGREFLKDIVQNKDWSVVYLDNFMIVLVRSDKALALKVKNIDMSKVDPSDYNFTSSFSYLELASFLANIGQGNQSIKFVNKSLAIFPDSPLANLLMANLLGQINDFNTQMAAEKYFSRSQKSIWW